MNGRRRKMRKKCFQTVNAQSKNFEIYALTSVGFWVGDCSTIGLERVKVYCESNMAMFNPYQ